MDKRKTGELIKNARKEKGYTQSELGNLIGVSNKAISRWENGESFPDIGLLEVLSVTLGLKIQDIVLGTIGGNDDEAITEVTKVAKMQEKAKLSRYTTIGLGIIIILYVSILGYSILTENAIFNLPVTVYYFLLAAILCGISYISILQKVHLFPRNNLISKLELTVSMITGVYIIISVCLTMWSISQGRKLLGIDISTVGPFLNRQIRIIFIINLVIILIDYFRMMKEKTDIHIGIFLSLANIQLVYLYCNLLHRLSALEGSYQMLISRTIAVIVEVLFAVIVTMIIKRKK